MLLYTPSQVLAYSLEPVRKAHYILELSDNQGRPLPGDAQLHISGLNGLADTIESTNYVMINSGFEYPTGHNPGSLNIKLRFFADKDQKVLAFFVNWRRAIRNGKTDSYGLYQDIVGQGTVKLFGPSERNGSKENPSAPTDPVLEIKLIDVWPKTLSIGDLDSEDEGTTQADFSVEMSVGELDFNV